jgi:acyl dehydratase
MGNVINLDRLGKSIGTAIHEYTERDVILYHLGIGARAEDMNFVYEGAIGGLKVCPTFAVVPMLEPLMNVLPQFNVLLRNVLHGEQVICLERTIPPRGTLLTTARVPAVYDKGKAAVLVMETETTDKAGKLLFRTRSSLFCTGLGGFGGDPGPKSPAREIPSDRPHDFEISQETSTSQAVLYRLSGDLNPLHVDPMAASFAGFPRPVLHGLCTFGFVGRALLRGACGNRVDLLKEFGVRFSAPVYPGEPVTTRGWNMGGGTYHLRVTSNGKDVLVNAYALVKES